MRSGLRRALHAVSPLVLAPALWLEWERVRDWLLLLAVGAALVELVRLKVPAVRERAARWIPVWRSHETTRASGALWLAVAFAIAARAPMAAALGGMLAAAWADPAASMVGSRFGRGTGKSVAGTLAVLVVTTGVAVGLGWPPAVGVVAGLTAAMLERWAVVPDDNLWLAPGVTLALVAFA